MVDTQAKVRRHLAKKKAGHPPSPAQANGQAVLAEEIAVPLSAPRKPPEIIEAYFEAPRSCFWAINGKNQWQQFNTDGMSRMLKTLGYFATTNKGDTASEIDGFLHKICFWKSVDWAGELGGWQVGRQEIGGLDVLVTRGNRPIKPKRGNYPLIRSFFKTLLGNKQLPYFLGWVKGSLQSLREGYPFRPGQLVAFAGGVNCGKSFAQLLVTHLLGGRQGDPTSFLVDKTEFNSDFLKAEHLCIEDRALKDFSYARRRNFAANLKGMIVNQDQRVHPKGKEATLLPVGSRITLSCNDSPEALAILPALDRDVADKLLYFRCGEGALPMRSNLTMTRKEQLDMFLAELPALVWWLDHWKIPKEILDPGNRFSVAAFHNEEIVEQIQHLSPEQRLLELLEVLELKWPPDGVYTGTAADIERWMRAGDPARLLDRILTYNASMGTLLAKIAKEGEERIKILPVTERRHRYQICKSEL